MEIYEQFDIEISTFALRDTENKDIISSSSSENDDHDNAFKDFDELE